MNLRKVFVCLTISVVAVLFCGTLHENAFAQGNVDTGATVTFDSWTRDGISKNSSIVIFPSKIEVGDAANIVVTVKFADGRPLSGATIYLNSKSLISHFITAPMPPTDSKGQSFATVSSLDPGTVSIMGKVVVWNYTMPIPGSATITFVPVSAPVFDPEPIFTKGFENTVSWNANETDASFYVEVAEDLEFQNITSNSGWIKETSYNFTNLVDATKYYYRVKTKNVHEIEGPWSDVIASTQDAIAPITSVTKAEEKNSSFSVTFTAEDKVSGIDHVIIFMKKDTGGWLPVANTTETLVTIKPDGSGTYCFYSQGFDKAGNIETGRSGADGDLCIDFKKQIFGGTVIQPVVEKVSEVAASVGTTIEEAVTTQRPTIKVVESVPTVTTAVSVATAVGVQFVNFPYSVWQVFLWFLEMIGVRPQRFPWGITYDAITKSPISRVVVRLFSGNKLIDTSVTDVNGVFAFAPNPGSYKLLASYPGYSFPSKIITMSTDGVYTGVYRGGNYAVGSDKTVLKVSIPLDPSKPPVLVAAFRKAMSFIVTLLVRSNPLFLLLGMMLSVYAYFQTLEPIQVVFFFVNLVLLGVNIYLMLATRDKWGTVVDEKNKLMQGIEVGLFERKYNRLIDYRVTDEKGRFQFIVPGDLYKLKILNKNFIATDKKYFDGFPAGYRSKGSIRISAKLKVRKLENPK